MPPSLDLLYSLSAAVTAICSLPQHLTKSRLWGLNPSFPCNFNEKLLPHGLKDRAGALFIAK